MFTPMLLRLGLWEERSICDLPVLSFHIDMDIDIDIDIDKFHLRFNLAQTQFSGPFYDEKLLNEEYLRALPYNTPNRFIDKTAYARKTE